MAPRSFDNTFRGMTKRQLEDAAGADLRHHLGRKIFASRDPRFASAPSFSFGGRLHNELDTLASNRSFFCKTGTHRCQDGETLLDDLRRRDDKSQKKLREQGRQWKAVPGPGSYRIPRFMGDIDRAFEVSVGKNSAPWRTPSWQLDSTSLRPVFYHTIGGVGHARQEHEGKLRVPTPRNLTPGPGHYFKDSDGCVSMFSDYMRLSKRAFSAAATGTSLPKSWYNIQADLPVPLPPPLHPGELRPCTPDDFAPLFPASLIEQEVSSERYLEIPAEVREVLNLWRPTPLRRASRWEKLLGLPGNVKIFYKYEGGSPSGSHKTNTAVPQVYYNKLAGTKKITTETGAGQWGSALAWSGGQFDLPIEVYQVKVSYEQKPYRKAFIEACGAEIFPSPSTKTAVGSKALEEDPTCPGSLGIAISEAIEACVSSEQAKYALGSVLSHVLMHQTVIGQEAIEQLAGFGEYPDVVVGCTGGGSNFAGIAFPFLGEKLRSEAAKPEIRFLAVEPAACPSLTRGAYAYDFGDTAKLTPLLKAHTLGSGFMPPSVHSGGLRYHAMAPLISHLKELGAIEAQAVQQTAAFDAGSSFFRAEGILPAPEATHAIEGALHEAKAAAAAGKPRVILFNMCGHGHFDMFAWEKYAKGQIEDFVFPEEDLKEALTHVPGLNGVNWPRP
ncbi:trpB2 [Symbiodinium sp. CCMP2456]|nr:trpB2 [Symbiodinium sp. CCMP2456]